MPRFQRIPRSWHLLILAGLVACGGQDARKPTRLDASEVRLVNEAMELIRIRLAATHDPEEAARLRAETGELYTKEELESLLDRLAADSARGEMVMAALHDSLEALREELFPPSGP